MPERTSLPGNQCSSPKPTHEYKELFLPFDERIDGPEKNIASHSASLNLVSPSHPNHFLAKTPKGLVSQQGGNLSRGQIETVFWETIPKNCFAYLKGVRIFFKPFRSTLYSFRVTNEIAEVRFHSIFQSASPKVFGQAFRLMFTRGRKAKRRIERSEYNQFILNIPPETFHDPKKNWERGERGICQGTFWDLEEVFERVNGAYFEGQMSKPKLVWSPKRARRLLASYNQERDRILVSRLFDSPKIPVLVLDYLIFHELIHKSLGISRRVPGLRRSLHGPEFRRFERRFKGYEEAIAFLRRKVIFSHKVQEGPS